MMGLFLGKQYCRSHKNSKMLALACLNPEICCVLESKNIHRRENGDGGEKNACVLWMAVGLFIWEDIA